MPFFSELVGKRVYDNAGREIGRLKDIFVSSDAPYPAINAIEILLPDKRTMDVPWRQVRNLEPNEISLSCKVEEIEPYQRLDSDLTLAKDVLDRQIVDTEGVKVVRVNDLQLSRVDGEYRLLGVDNSAGGLLRRLGLSRLMPPLENRLQRNLIKWEDIDLIPSNIPMVKLKVSHEHLSQLHPADIADIVQQLSADAGKGAIESLTDEIAARAVAEVEPERQVAILERIPNERAADILEEMAPDDAADLLADIPDEKAEQLLQLMEPEAARDVRELMTYEEDSAGGLMTTDYIAIPKDLTAEQVISKLREMAPDAETIYYLYVTDEQEHLLGVLSLRDLVVVPPETRVEQFMRTDVAKVNVQDKLVTIARTLDKYNLLAIPVVDDENRLQGVITADDVMENIMPRSWRRRAMRMAG